MVSLTGCREEPTTNGEEFRPQYTQEEHIQRIAERTQEIFAKEIDKGLLLHYNVEIVYPFSEGDRQYFLVELEYGYEWTGKFENVSATADNDEKYITYRTRYKHFIGVIIDDEYYMAVWNYDGDDPKSCFMDGRSAYAVAGYSDRKKYCGGAYQGVEVDGEFIMVADRDCLIASGETYEFHVHGATCGDTYPVGEVMPEHLVSVLKYDYYANMPIYAYNVTD